jgi:hypothetical protein
MATIKRRYSEEEFARRGDELVESKVRPNPTAADHDKSVAIDIDTGESELDKNDMKASDRLRKRVPDAQIWLGVVKQLPTDFRFFSEGEFHSSIHHGKCWV